MNPEFEIGIADPENALEFLHLLEKQEARFDQNLSRLRALAAAWMISLFLVLSLLINQINDSYIIASRLLIAVSFLGLFGLFIFWCLDRWMYQRFIRSSMLVGLALEFSNPTLPPLRRVRAACTKFGGSRVIGLFYIVPAILFLVATVAFVILFLTPPHVPLDYLMWFVLLYPPLFISLVWLVFSIQESKAPNQMSDLVYELPDQFCDIATRQRVQEFIQDHSRSSRGLRILVP